MMNLKTAFSALKIIVAVVPLIKELIDVVEAPGHGPEKKKAVLGALNQVLSKLNVSSTVRSIVEEVASWLIDTIVAIRHLTGVWEHSTTKPVKGGD